MAFAERHYDFFTPYLYSLYIYMTDELNQGSVAKG
jgi:hypothetical protein